MVLCVRERLDWRRLPSSQVVLNLYPEPLYCFETYLTVEYDPFIKSQLASAQSLGRCMVQTWSRNPRNFEATKLHRLDPNAG